MIGTRKHAIMPLSIAKEKRPYNGSLDGKWPSPNTSLRNEHFQKECRKRPIQSHVIHSIMVLSKMVEVKARYLETADRLHWRLQVAKISRALRSHYKSPRAIAIGIPEEQRLYARVLSTLIQFIMLVRHSHDRRSNKNRKFAFAAADVHSTSSRIHAKPHQQPRKAFPSSFINRLSWPQLPWPSWLQLP